MKRSPAEPHLSGSRSRLQTYHVRAVDSARAWRPSTAANAQLLCASVSAALLRRRMRDVCKPRGRARRATPGARVRRLAALLTCDLYAALLFTLDGAAACDGVSGAFLRAFAPAIHTRMDRREGERRAPRSAVTKSTPQHSFTRVAIVCALSICAISADVGASSASPLDESAAASQARSTLTSSATTTLRVAEAENVYPDRPLRSHSLHGRLVHCNTDVDVKVEVKAYPDPIYTCRNLSVDGLRMMYGIYGRSAEALSPCGTDPGSSSLYDLCSAMLAEAGVGEPTVAAHVTEVVCITGDTGKRMLFVRNGTSSHWEVNELRTGYVLTLRCVTKRPQSHAFRLPT